MRDWNGRVTIGSLSFVMVDAPKKKSTLFIVTLTDEIERETALLGKLSRYYVACAESGLIGTTKRQENL